MHVAPRLSDYTIPLVPHDMSLGSLRLDTDIHLFDAPVVYILLLLCVLAGECVDPVLALFDMIVESVNIWGKLSVAYVWSEKCRTCVSWL